jgi:tetratricopeptide (TPR) repeat protein
MTQLPLLRFLLLLLFCLLAYPFLGQSIVEEMEKENAQALQNNNLRKAAILTFNLGEKYLSLGDYEKAEKRLTEAIELNKQTGNIKKVAEAYRGLGNIKREDFRFQEALNMFQLSGNYYETLNDKPALTEISIAAATMRNRLGRYSQAIQQLRQAEDLATQQEMKDMLALCYQQLSYAHEKIGNRQNAIMYNQMYVSFSEQDKQEGLLALTLQIEQEQAIREQEINLLEKDKELQEALLKKQSAQLQNDKLRERLMLFGIVAGLLLAGVLGAGYYKLQKKNKLLVAQKIRIEQQKQALSNAKVAIEESNRQVTDSIRYAEEIQMVTMPPVGELQQAFADSFVLFKPKDIVSGDFYWFSTTPNTALVVVADCTGHGVPGAFMTMIGHMLLHKLVHDQKITSPALLLQELHKGVREALRQAEDGIDDGMDAGICYYTFNEPETLVYAGAKRPLYLVDRAQELRIIRPDRKSIGGMQREKERTFNNQVVHVNEGEMVYLTTDG